MNGNVKKTVQLGEPYGTASNRLKKMILFECVTQLEKNKCYRCGEVINTHQDLSIEHKIPWLDSEDPKKLFFDLDNISFSHLTCNIAAARKVAKYSTEELRLEASRKSGRERSRKCYTPERRHARYLKHGC